MNIEFTGARAGLQARAAQMIANYPQTVSRRRRNTPEHQQVIMTSL